MAKRKRIALRYTMSYEQMSSIPIYIQNIVKALLLIEDNKKPEVVIFYQDGSPIDDIKKINYPYIEYVNLWPKYSIEKRFINKIFRALNIKQIWQHPNLPKLIDIIYPYKWGDVVEKCKKKIFWITDMQQFRLPQYFSKKELEDVENQFLKISTQNELVVFSSKTSKNDYFEFFPNAIHKSFILNFAVFTDLSNLPTKQELLDKYNLKSTYFVTPNQFWPHKNHKLLLKAVNKVCEKNNNFDLVLTGVSRSYRNEDLGQELEDYITQNKLKENVSILGFIPRNDLLGLMKYAKAIIQPSLFEGWSTLVEEAKALNQFIIVSDIDLHKEQIEKNCLFFSKHNEIELAECIFKVLTQNIKIETTDYYNNQFKFASDLAVLFKL